MDSIQGVPEDIQEPTRKKWSQNVVHKSCIQQTILSVCFQATVMVNKSKGVSAIQEKKSS